MGELQWALLIVCVVLVIILYVLSRRAGDVVDDEDKYNPMGKPSEGSGQSDLFGGGSQDGFDEFGVGKKRKAKDPKPPRTAPTAGEAGGKAPEDTLLEPLPDQTVEPRKKWMGRKKKDEQPEAREAAAPAPAPEGKTVALILAHTEENDIEGPALHAALTSQGLRFGEGAVYHRVIGGQSIYTIASLIKPGTLVPDEADSFSTKGLAVVLNLPGPVAPVAALDDMMEATVAIAKALKVGIFDAQRQPLTAATGAAMRADVEQWSATHKLG